jgi:hypothetical protein
MIEVNFVRGREGGGGRVRGEGGGEGVSAYLSA